jgi:hypothetical protein
MGLLDTVLRWPGVSEFKTTDQHIIAAFAAFGTVALVIHVLHYRMERLEMRRAAGMKGDVNLR